MSKTVSIDNLANVISAELADYSEEVSEEVKASARECSEELMKSIREDARRKLKGTGKYAKGWRSKKKSEGKDYIRYITYNATDYQLTHLLEFGHEKWVFGKNTGERVRAIPHIRPNADKWCATFEKYCKIVLSGKG